MKIAVIITTGVIFIILTFMLVATSVQKNPDTEITPTSSPSVLPTLPVTPSPLPDTGEKNIIISSPQQGSTVSLPIVIKGKARVFENQFNYRLRIPQGQTILEGTVYTNSKDAGEYGDFQIIISSVPSSLKGSILMELFDYSAKDGSKIDLVSLPLFISTANTTLLKVYFGDKNAPTGEECDTFVPAERRIVSSPSIAKAALEELLKGPFTLEKNKGLYTSLKQGTKLNKITIVNGVATADFDSSLDKNIGGSCLVTAIRGQITQTLKQFASVKSVVISVDGRTEDILQP